MYRRENELVRITYRVNDEIIDLEVTSEVANVLLESDRKMQALYKQDQRHLTKDGYIEGRTELNMFKPPVEIINIVRDKDIYTRLHKAIDCLPKVPRRRLMMYYFENLTYREIALIEGASEGAIRHSIKLAIKKLKKMIRLGTLSLD